MAKLKTGRKKQVSDNSGGPATVGKAPKKNLAVTLVIVVFIAILAVALFSTLSVLFATEDYYVLNQDVAARVRVVPQMLQKVTVSRGGAPQNAISIQQVAGGLVYTRTPLNAGDVLSRSNTGLNLDNNVGVPDDWVITSFNISSSQAAAGRIMRGDYFDIIAIDNIGARYVLIDVLALDVNYASGTQNQTGQVSGMNEQLQYIVGLPPEDAALLADVMEGSGAGSIKLVLSPMSLYYKERNIDEIDGYFSFDDSLQVKSLYEGTDDTFTPVLRDNNNRPVNRLYCESGKIDPPELCDRLAEVSNEISRDEEGEFITESETQNNDLPPLEEETTADENPSSSR